MDTNNWRPAQPGGEPAVDSVDWRTHLQPDSRQRIINKVMETLKRHLPFSGPEGVNELRKIACRFEEKIYSAATSQPDYLRKISMKMLTMETKSQNAIPNSLPAGSSGNSNKPMDPGSHSMQTQVHSQGQSLPISLPANQSQTRQQLNIQNNIVSGVQASASLPSSVLPVSGLSQTTMPSDVGQGSNMQNISSISQNSGGNSMGQGVSSNMFGKAQMQIQARQQTLPQQHQQQSQNPQYIYKQQLQQQLMNQKFQQGNLSHSIMPSHMQPQQQQQQQQQNLLQTNQLQSSQQAGIQTSSVMQASAMQSAPLSGLQQNQQSSSQQSAQSMLQQHQQSVIRQQQQSQQSAGMHQQQTQMAQPSILSSQQQQQQKQQLMGQHTSATSMQQNQLIGQQATAGDMQQQQRLLCQQNNLSNLQQRQQQQRQQQQQQLMAQQNNLSSIHQQQLGNQSNASGLQQSQQQLLGSQSGNQSMQSNQHSAHMLSQSKVTVQQQAQQGASSLLTQGQQSQPQLTQQQMMPQIQSQPAQLHMQQHPSLMQQRLQAQGQASGTLQPQNIIDQQKQLLQSQRPLPESSSTSLDSTAQTGNSNGGDWQEEIYQKIKAMKELYFAELSDVYQKLGAKLQLHEALQQPKSDQLDKLKTVMVMVERIVQFLSISKAGVTPAFKEKCGFYEKQILSFLSTNRPRKQVQQGQLPPTHMQSMQQSQSQIAQQSHDSQVNPQLQPMNLQGSMPTMQQSSLTNFQHSSVASISGASTGQQTMLNSMQPGSNFDGGQGNGLSSLQQVSLGTLQQNSGSTSQQANINSVSSQTGVNAMQPNVNPLQSNSGMLQNQHPKQQQELLQTQQLKQQFQQRQMQQQQLIQKQLLQQQQFHQQTKQPLPSQMQTHQIQQLQQINDLNDLKIRQGLNAKPGVFQQQRTAYALQQLKPTVQFPISSPQLLQASSPQMPQHSSPQVDQQNLMISKTGTPLQSANSPFVVPSPSTPAAPSPMPGDSEKPISGTFSLSNAGGLQQITATQGTAQSLAIGTPGISASPLLAEFTGGSDGTQTHASTIVSGKLSATEQPLDRLIKAVKSMSSKALSASVSDIGSVVSMMDRIAGSAPGNGSRAAAGEDLVAMTKCRLQARNFVTQDGMSGSRKMKRYTSAMPLNAVSSAGSINDSFKHLPGSETSDLESTATSSVKRLKFEPNNALSEELREINQQLIDTVVDISDEDVDPIATTAGGEGGEGTIVKFSFIAVALSPNMKSQYSSAQMSSVQPLRLLVPSNYPKCSPVFLDKFPVEMSEEHEDISVKVNLDFSRSLRSLSQPMSLQKIASTWDTCVRGVISKYAQQRGGGSFSSKYGSWEDCSSAA